MSQTELPWQEAAQAAEKSGNTEDASRVQSASEAGVTGYLPKFMSVLGKHTGLDEKQRAAVNGKKREHTLQTAPMTRAIMKGQESQRASTKPAVRTIPAWVRSAEEDDLISNEPDFSHLRSPDSAFVAQHNCNPTIASRTFTLSDEGYNDGLWPTSTEQRHHQRQSRWVTFAKSSAYPHENFNGEKMDPDWLNEHCGDYSRPWLADQDDDDAEDRYHAFQRKRQVWYKRSQFTILRNPFIPLVFRTIVFTFAMIAMALGASVYRLEQRVGHNLKMYQGGPSAEMAIIVDGLALVYIAYITYDEYFSKPLGLRSPRAKVRLILLDLFFIVFQTANLSLAFDSMSNNAGACKNGNTDGTQFTFPNICDRTEALAAVLLISLIAWLMTFSISVFRLVERINIR